jgi:hypothetical protein
MDTTRIVASFDDRHVYNRCAYCGVDLPDSDAAEVPAVDDDAEWAELAAQHAPDCEWIATRAHRINPDDPSDPRGYQAH